MSDEKQGGGDPVLDGVVNTSAQLEEQGLGRYEGARWVRFVSIILGALLLVGAVLGGPKLFRIWAVKRVAKEEAWLTATAVAALPTVTATLFVRPITATPDDDIGGSSYTPVAIVESATAVPTFTPTFTPEATATPTAVTVAARLSRDVVCLGIPVVGRPIGLLLGGDYVRLAAQYEDQAGGRWFRVDLYHCWIDASSVVSSSSISVDTAVVGLVGLDVLTPTPTPVSESHIVVRPTSTVVQLANNDPSGGQAARPVVPTYTPWPTYTPRPTYTPWPTVLPASTPTSVPSPMPTSVPSPTPTPSPTVVPLDPGDVVCTLFFPLVFKKK